MSEEARIDEAIRGIYFSSLTAAERRAALAPYGESVATRVDAILDEALTGPPGFDGDVDTGRDWMHAMLRERYPWLSEAARTRLDYTFLMTWK